MTLWGRRVPRPQGSVESCRVSVACRLPVEVATPSFSQTWYIVNMHEYTILSTNIFTTSFLTTYPLQCTYTDRVVCMQQEWEMQVSLD